jgi:hypothetical protein
VEVVEVDAEVVVEMVVVVETVELTSCVRALIVSIVLDAVAS